MSSYCDYLQNQEKGYSKPMPWIGLYIAVASLVCTLAMAADIFHGFRHRKLWFPCKYFTLNAASLTVIAIAMKLPVDLNNRMPRDVDQLSKLSGTVFMCTMLANFMPSLSAMSNNELLSNLIALVILVITIAVNICIQISTNVIHFGYAIFHIISVTFMLSLLVILVSSAVTIPDTKRILEIKYRKMHKGDLDEESEHTGKSIVDKLMQRVSKYWIMAETGSPQFVMACSPTCSACGAMCLILAFFFLTLSSLHLMPPILKGPCISESDYKWSIIPVLVIQSVGVLVGTIAPIFRWFSALTFKLSLKLSLNVFIGFQVIIVVVCKMICLIPIFLVIMVVYFWHCSKWLKHNLLMGKLSSSNDPKETESNQQRVSTKPDLSPYVLQLQDEVELGKRTLRSISKAVNKLIHKAEKQQSNNLMKLLEKSMGFQGVAEFDNDQVPPLQYDQELQALNCWSLVVVTLTSILIALPNIRSSILDLILRGVSEGLSYVSLVEESLYANKSDLANIIKAASDVWLEVELYGKWLDNNLQGKVHKGKTSKEILEWLGEKAKSVLKELEYSKNRGLDLEDRALQKIIAANSMYRISHTILLDYQSKDYEADEMLFEKLSIMIADILGACLSNLPCVITIKCYADAIEKREESVRVAARILGETKDIMELILGRFDIPNLNPDQMANIDGWRAAAKHQSPSSLLSTSNNESTSSGSAELVKVTVQ